MGTVPSAVWKSPRAESSRIRLESTTSIPAYTSTERFDRSARGRATPRRPTVRGERFDARTAREASGGCGPHGSRFLCDRDRLAHQSETWKGRSDIWLAYKSD